MEFLRLSLLGYTYLFLDQKAGGVNEVDKVIHPLLENEIFIGLITPEEFEKLMENAQEPPPADLHLPEAYKKLKRIKTS